MSPSRKRRAIHHLLDKFEVSERRACALLEQPRATQRYAPRRPAKDQALMTELRGLTRQYPRFGYRRMAQLLRRRGWAVNTKRVQRLRAAHGLQVVRERHKRRRLGHSDNGCARHRPERPNHVWSVDFISDQTEDGRKLKMLVVLDEFTRQNLAIDVQRSIRAGHVIDLLERLFLVHGQPEHVRSDNGPEFIAYAIQDYLADRNVGPLYIAPGSPWENGYVESFNSRFRDEHLGQELFGNLREAQILTEIWRHAYNHERPHSSLDYATPMEFFDQWQASTDTTSHHEINQVLS